MDLGNPRISSDLWHIFTLFFLFNINLYLAQYSVHRVHSLHAFREIIYTQDHVRSTKRKNSSFLCKALKETCISYGIFLPDKFKTKGMKHKKNAAAVQLFLLFSFFQSHQNTVTKFFFQGPFDPWLWFWNPPFFLEVSRSTSMQTEWTGKVND